MSLVLNNLINKINNRLDAADSDGTSFSTIDLQRLSRLNNKVNGEAPLGTIQYRSLGHIPPAEDSAGLGQIVFVKDEQLDSDGRYYYRAASTWTHLITGTDSDENDLITAAAAPAPTGPSNPYQGTVNGYVAGGNPTTPAADAKELDRFPFASDTNGTDIGGLSHSACDASGGGSPTDGYAIGGVLASQPNGTIQKYPYASDTVSTPTDTGENLRNTQYRHGQKEMLGNRDYIYVAGGRTPTAVVNTIYKFAPGSEGTITDVGNLLETQQHLASASSPTHGYVAGGSQPVGGSPDSNRIQKWAWATDADATDVGDLTATYIGNVGASSITHGYSISGLRAGNNTATNIEKYTFSSDANSTDVGDSVTNIRYSAGLSSGTHGYSAGGQQPPGNTESNVIQKFPFATDENATDVGDLSRTYRRAATSQSRV